MDTKQLHEFLVKNQDKGTTWLANETGRNTRTIREHLARLRAKGQITTPVSPNGIKRAELTPEQQLLVDIEKIKAKEDGKDQKYQAALKQIAKLQDKIDGMQSVSADIDGFEIKPTGSKKTESVAFAIASDWHIEERVDPETVGGTNSYSLAESKRRATNFFVNTVELVKKEQAKTHIDTLVLGLLGDFFSGYIHPELVSVCEVGPVPAAMLAKQYLMSGIDYILKNTKLKIVIPCCVGNHSRITDKTQIANEYAMSLEWMIYNDMAERYAKNKRVQFLITKNYFNTVTVYGDKIRMQHGHRTKSGGGYGGIMIPLTKAVHKNNQGEKQPPVLDVFGHYHTRLHVGNIMVNGSLIGNTPYCYTQGMRGEAEQQFFLYQKGHGVTIVAPIFVK